MAIINNIAHVHDLLRTQKVEKPQIDDLIPDYLNGENKKAALDFVAYLRENKIKPVWTIANAWKATYKGKTIYYIRLPLHESHFRNLKQSEGMSWENSWVFTPYLHNMNSYEELVINENLREFVLSGLHYCVPCAYRLCPKEKTIFGENIQNLCGGALYGDMALWYVNPDETEIGKLKRLLEFEKAARI